MSDLWVRKIPWERKWKLTTVFLPGESHGQGSLTDYSPWGHKELDTTKQLSMSTSPKHDPESIVHGLRSPVQSLVRSQNIKGMVMKKGHEFS